MTFLVKITIIYNMKIIYNTDIQKSINIKVNDKIYELYPEETIDIENEQQNTVYLYTSKTERLNIWHKVLMFLKSLILCIFKIILMDAPANWFDGVDPAVISANYDVEGQSVDIRYVSSKISKAPILIKQPELIVNDKDVDVNIDFDINAVNTGFLKYCFDLISLGIYNILLITIICICSHQRVMAVIGLVIIFVILLLPIILKIKKVYREKTAIIQAIDCICKR